MHYATYYKEGGTIVATQVRCQEVGFCISSKISEVCATDTVVVNELCRIGPVLVVRICQAVTFQTQLDPSFFLCFPWLVFNVNIESMQMIVAILFSEHFLSHSWNVYELERTTVKISAWRLVCSLLRHMATTWSYVRQYPKMAAALGKPTCVRF
jgi:hypothetical protein